MLVHDKPKQEAKSAVPKKEPEQTASVPNETGIPDAMKAGFEELSGFSFDDVRVHYNSGKPAQLKAVAYAQGNQVYVAPGQEKHLGHELGHIVQQRQGRVSPTTEVDGIKINDDIGLEREADALGQRAARYYPDAPGAYMKFAGVIRSKEVLQGRFGDVAQRIDAYWEADERWNVINPKPVGTDPAGRRWFRAGGLDDRLYNTDGEAKAAAAAALGVSFATIATNEEAEQMTTQDTKADGFRAIRSHYENAIVTEDAEATAAADHATASVDAFGTVNEKLYDAYIAIANSECHQRFTTNKETKGTAAAIAANKKQAADAAVSHATGNAVANADDMTNAATIAAKAEAQKVATMADATSPAITAAINAGGKEVHGIAKYIAKKEANVAKTDKHDMIAGGITNAMLTTTAAITTTTQEAKEGMKQTYKSGVGEYSYCRPVPATDNNKIKKGTPVLAKHTGDPHVTLKRKRNTDAAIEISPVPHWHAGIVREEKDVSFGGVQPEYKQASGIAHFFIKPT